MLVYQTKPRTTRNLINITELIVTQFKNFDTWVKVIFLWLYFATFLTLSFWSLRCLFSFRWKIYWHIHHLGLRFSYLAHCVMWEGFFHRGQIIDYEVVWWKCEGRHLENVQLQWSYIVSEHNVAAVQCTKSVFVTVALAFFNDGTIR